MRADGYHAIPLESGSIFAKMVPEGASYILEHLVIMALEIGRPLHPGETVWHISGDKSDNRPENLILLSDPQVLRRTIAEGHVGAGEIVWRPDWANGLNRRQMVERARAEVVAP